MNRLPFSCLGAVWQRPVLKGAGRVLSGVEGDRVKERGRRGSAKDLEIALVTSAVGEGQKERTRLWRENEG